MNATGVIPFSTWRGNLTRSEVNEAIDNCDNWHCDVIHPQCKMYGKVDDNDVVNVCALHDLYEEQLTRDREAMTRWTSE